MNRLRVPLLLLLASPVLLFGQRKEYVELQRDVALLQDQVRSLQRSVDEKMAALTILVQQSLDNVNKMNTTVAVLDNAIRERMKEQSTSLVGPVTAVGSKVDQMSSEFQALRASIDDMTSRLGKLERQMVDLSNTVKVIQAPATAPPGAAGLPAGVSADSLYANAMRDKDAGNYDIALQEFNDYLKYFSNTDTAPNAQFYIGEINFRKGNLDEALQSFDMVLEKFPQNNKTLDAMYMKGQTLFKMGSRKEAAAQYRELIRTAPTSELAAKAKAQLKAMGLSTATPARRPKKK